MATQPTYPTQMAIEAADMLDCIRMMARRCRERMRRHRVRVLVKWLRRTADRGTAPRRNQLLLHDRVAAVRTDLYEIAWLLEHANEPDPECIDWLREMLANGCQSPLYNDDVHDSELRATLYYARAALLGHARDTQPHVH